MAGKSRHVARNLLGSASKSTARPTNITLGIKVHKNGLNQQSTVTRNSQNTEAKNSLNQHKKMVAENGSKDRTVARESP